MVWLGVLTPVYNDDMTDMIYTTHNICKLKAKPDILLTIADKENLACKVLGGRIHQIIKADRNPYPKWCD